MKPSSLMCISEHYLIFIISVIIDGGFNSRDKKVKSAYEWLWYIPFTEVSIHLGDISVGAPANVLFQGRFGEEQLLA